MTRLRPFLLALALAACPSGAGPAPANVRVARWPIVGGSLDTNPRHAAVAFIEMYDGYGQVESSCTGTLVADKVILTAGHCVSDYDGVFVGTPGRYGVFFDTNADGTPDWPKTPCSLTCTYWPCSCTANKNVAQVQRESGYDDNWGNVGVPVNDVGLLKLAASAPPAVTPIPALTPTLAAANLKATSTVEFVGYGLQDYPGVACCDENGQPRGCAECPSGTRFHVVTALNAVCSNTIGCGGTPPWTISYAGDAGPCSGDSGGPALLTVNGTQYVAGVTSYGDASCQYEGTSAKVDHYAAFLDAAIGTKAADGAACTAASQCQSGFCADGVCCSAACDRLCQACSVAAGAAANGKCQVVEGKACSDGSACTLNDTCRAGACVPGAAKDCSGAAGTCTTAGTCDPATGACKGGAPRPDGTACEDGDLCTLSDACLAGACKPGAAKVCEPNDACHKPGQCDWTTGKCAYVARPNGLACDDGDPSTVNDACSVGSCTGASECAGKADGTACATGQCAAGLCVVPPKSDGCGGCGASGAGPQVLGAVAALAALAGRRRR